MRARYWSQRDDQHDQDCSRGQRIREQGYRDISAGQLFSHNSRANNRRQKKGSSHELRYGAGA